MKFIAAAFLFTICFISCKKDNNTTDNSNATINVKYDVVSCCNFWEDANCDLTDIIASAKCFLDNADIVAEDLEVVQEGPICICISCCGCCEGVTLKLKTTENDLAEIEDLGFVLE